MSSHRLVKILHVKLNAVGAATNRYGFKRISCEAYARFAGFFVHFLHVATAGRHTHGLLQSEEMRKKLNGW